VTWHGEADWSADDLVRRRTRVHDTVCNYAALL
jgi:hypothetical protein